jgi:hypothetical protein
MADFGFLKGTHSDAFKKPEEAGAFLQNCQELFIGKPLLDFIRHPWQCQSIIRASHFPLTMRRPVQQTDFIEVSCSKSGQGLFFLPVFLLPTMGPEADG